MTRREQADRLIGIMIEDAGFLPVTHWRKRWPWQVEVRYRTSKYHRLSLPGGVYRAFTYAGIERKVRRAWS